MLKSSAEGCRDQRNWVGWSSRRGWQKARKRQGTEDIEKLKPAETGELPVERLLRRMNDTSLPEQYRDQIAIAVAGFIHPRLSAVAVVKRPSQMTQAELDQLEAALKEDLLRLGVGRDQWPRAVS